MIRSIFLLSLLIGSPAVGQGRLPSVDEIMERYDRDKDGELTRHEVQTSRFAGQFDRWDADQDGKVNATDVIRYRARFGIAADGGTLKGTPGRKANRKETFAVPRLQDLPRVTREHPPNADQRSQSAFVLKTVPHRVAGNRYGILTDHSDKDYTASLRKLATHRNAEWIGVASLAELHSNPTEFLRVQNELRRRKIKHLAIAPRMETFRENTVLGLWKLLSTLDEDPELDVLPGFLVASDASSFSRLIDQSINHQAVEVDQQRPLAISQVSSDAETRSLQKSAVLRQAFSSRGISMPIAAIYNPRSINAPRLKDEPTWNLTTKGNRSFITDMPKGLARAFTKSNLIIMHGHGIPGMSCSLDVDGLPKDMTGKILLTGSCFSAVPTKSDLPAMRKAPGGYDVQPRDAFVIRAIDQGALVAFGHQRLSHGFPHLYPVLESWTAGKTVGTAYQELINAIIQFHDLDSDEFVVTEPIQRPKQNILLYVVIGDPALQLFTQ